MRTETRSIFLHGMRDGFPIGMGYFAVSFSLGIIAAKAGLTAWMGFVGSFLTRASAGEYGVYSLIAIGIAALTAANLLEHQAEMARRALGRRPSKGIRRRMPYG